MIGGAFGLVTIVWGIDMLTGGPAPSSAAATPAAVVAPANVAPLPDPADLEAVIAALSDDHAPLPALPFQRVTRDLFAPTPSMEAALALAAPALSGKSELREEPAAEPLPFPARHELQGVLMGRVPLALIDGHLCRRGTEIDGYRLVEVRRDYVVLQRGQSRVTLRVVIAGRSE